MKIFTHGHRSHMDELLAAAILVAVYNPDNLNVLRVNSEKELPDTLGEEDFIVDVGGVYDGNRRFDHHQSDDFRVEHRCAATLVASKFYPELLKHPVWGEFLARVELQDTQGVPAVERRYNFPGYPREIAFEWALVRSFEHEPETAARLVARGIQGTFKGSSPIDLFEEVVGEAKEAVIISGTWDVALSRFYREENLQPAFGLMEDVVTAYPLRSKGLLRGFFRREAEFYREVEQAKEWLLGNSEVEEVGGVKCLRLTRDAREDGITPQALNKSQDGVVHSENIAAVISFDPRSEVGTTRTLFRTREEGEKSGVDFTRCKPENPRFCHKAGFLLTFDPKDEEEWKTLVTESLPS